MRVKKLASVKAKENKRALREVSKQAKVAKKAAKLLAKHNPPPKGVKVMGEQKKAMRTVALILIPKLLKRKNKKT